MQPNQRLRTRMRRKGPDDGGVSLMSAVIMVALVTTGGGAIFH